MGEITQILSRLEQGDVAAADQLLPLVYEELRQLAEARLAHEKPGQTLQATALVHEAYLRLVGGTDDVKWDNLGHFFGAAAEAMRRLLIEQARRKRAARHGGHFRRVSIELGDLSGQSRDDDLVTLDSALERLERLDETKAKLVKLRYFAGLTNSQAAAALGIGVSTADRYWAFSRCWLRSEITRMRGE